MKKSNIKIWSWVVCISAVIMIAALMLFGMSAVERFSKIQEQWETYNEKVTLTNQTLAKLKGSIGYGGFIHNFKNYVMRRDIAYEVRIENDIKNAKHLQKLYAGIVSLEAEHHALRTIDMVLTNYFDNFLLAKKMIADGHSSADIDAIVIIDDTPALEAFDTLIEIAAERSRSMENQTNTELRSAVQFMSIGTLLMFLVAGIAVLVVWFIRKLTTINTQMQTANNQINLLYDIAPDPMICVRPDGTISKCNLQAEALFGYTRSELMSMSVEDLMPEAFREYHKKLRADYFHSPVHRPLGMGLELLAQTKNGQQPFVEISLSHSNTGDTPLSTITIHDITKRKNREQNLEQYAQELEHSNKDLEHFANAISHDLQEPLRKIQTFSDRLKMNCVDLVDERGRGDLNRIITSVTHMRALVNDLLSFSQITSKAQSYIKCDLSAIINEILGDLQSLIDEVGAKILIEDLPTIHADQAQIYQMLHHLISNAIKFRRNDTPLIIHIKSEIIAEKTRITISDNGIGFDPKYASQILDLFERLHGRQEYSGSGIGLAACKKIAVRHGGNIIAQGRPDEGSMFIITLPIKPSERRL